jgi:hypothetical protein
MSWLSLRGRSMLAVGLLAGVAALALLPGKARADADTTPPAVQSIAVSPSSVDVTSGAQSVTVTATITDDSAVYWGYVTWTSPSGTYSTTAYLSAAGGATWSGTANVQRYVQPGDWDISSLVVYDTAGNVLSLNAGGVAAAGLGAPISVTSVEDALPPQLNSVTLSPATVDITNSSPSVTVDVDVSDDASGVQWLQGAWQSPSGNRTQYVNFSRSAPGSDDWVGTLSLPRWTETGDWHVFYLYAGDGAGRYTYLSGAAVGPLDTVLHVTGTEDLASPTVQSISVSPAAVDDGNGPKTVNVSAPIDDVVSGVQWAQVACGSPSGYWATAYLSPSSPGSSVWTGTATIWQHAEEGTWHVVYAATADNANNSTYLYGAAIAAAGLDAPVTVTDTPELPVDHFKVRVSPSSVAAGDTFTLTVTAQDSLNQTVPGYVGPVAISDVSGSLGVVSPFSWTGGVGTETVTVPHAFHADQIEVADGSGLSTAPSGTSNTFNVVGPLDHMSVRLASSTPSAGAKDDVTITAYDALNQVTTFAGPVTLTDLSGSMSVVTPLASTGGVATGAVAVASPYHADRLTATAGAISSQSPSFNVIGPLDHFRVVASPTSVTAGAAALTLTLTAQDALNQTVGGYTGAVGFTDLSGTISIGTPPAWGTGVATTVASVTGPYKADRVTVSDGAGHSGQSNTFNVIGPVDHLQTRVSPASASVGTPFTVTVTAQDALNQTVTTYSNALTLNDLSATFAAAAVSWSSGVATLTGTVASAYHADRVTVTDPGGLSGQSNTFNVIGAATHLVVKASPSSVLVRSAVTITVTAQDALNQTVTSYSGSPLSFSDLSGNLLVASSATWSGGTGTATVKVTVPYRADRVSVFDWWTGLGGQSNTFNVI